MKKFAGLAAVALLALGCAPAEAPKGAAPPMPPTGTAHEGGAMTNGAHAGAAGEAKPADPAAAPAADPAAPAADPAAAPAEEKKDESKPQ